MTTVRKYTVVDMRQGTLKEAAGANFNKWPSKSTKVTTKKRAASGYSVDAELDFTSGSTHTNQKASKDRSETSTMC